MVWLGLSLAAGSCADFENLGLAPDASRTSCELVHPPAPAIVSGPSGGPGDFTVVIWHEDFGDRPDAGRSYTAIGYDLDDACTLQDAGYGCLEPTWATADHTDGPGGLDNAMGAILYQATLRGGESATDLVYSGTKRGLLQMAIRVRGYNELDVEGIVDVAYYGVTIHQPLDGGSSLPNWDGKDAWDVVPNWLEPPEAGADFNLDRPVYEDKAAYVTSGGLLVSKMDQLLIGGAPLYHLANVVVTAQIVRRNNGWVLENGTIAGRLPMSEVLAYLAYARDPSTPGLFCQEAGSYSTLKGFACSYADVKVAGQGGGLQRCDGVSWAWQFTDTAAITLAGTWSGGAFSNSPPDGACPPGRSPIDDHCGP